MKIRFYIFSCVVLFSILFTLYGRSYWHPMSVKVMGKKTVAEVITMHGKPSRKNLKPLFLKAGVAYPPKQVTILATKDTDTLEVWAKSDTDWKYINQYPILAASGQLGPKLKEGDHQVPEGIYRIIGLNPNSSYHLSMKLNYPNDFDLHWADKENRTEPGSNIFIHGKAVSVGCLAMGDSVIEDLFVLAHDVGTTNMKVIIAPTDPRNSSLIPPAGSSAWVSTLYKQIENQFNQFRSD